MPVPSAIESPFDEHNSGNADVALQKSIAQEDSIGRTGSPAYLSMGSNISTWPPPGPFQHQHSTSIPQPPTTDESSFAGEASARSAAQERPHPVTPNMDQPPHATGNMGPPSFPPVWRIASANNDSDHEEQPTPAATLGKRHRTSSTTSLEPAATSVILEHTRQRVAKPRPNAQGVRKQMSATARRDMIVESHPFAAVVSERAVRCSGCIDAKGIPQLIKLESRKGYVFYPENWKKHLLKKHGVVWRFGKDGKARDIAESSTASSSGTIIGSSTSSGGSTSVEPQQAIEMPDNYEYSLEPYDAHDRPSAAKKARWSDAAAYDTPSASPQPASPSPPPPTRAADEDAQEHGPRETGLDLLLRAARHVEAEERRMGDFGAPAGASAADYWCEHCGGNDPDQQQDRARTWTMAPYAQDYGYQREGAPADQPHYAYGAYPPYMRQPEPHAWYYPSAEEYARYDMHNTR